MLLGAGVALMVLADLGLSPWDVLHQGISVRSGLSIGMAGIVVGLAVLAAWIPLRQRPGIGTLINVLIVGTTVDLVLALLDEPEHTIARWAFLLVGVVIVSAGTALYLSAHLGPGPRDGLMTSLAGRTTHAVGRVRTAMELTVLGIGWLLGGSVGAGTVVVALAIGPLLQLFLGYLMTPVPTLTPPAE